MTGIPQTDAAELIKIPMVHRIPIENHSFINSIKKIKRWLLNGLASVKLTIFLISLLATTVLIGAWCPQISQVGEGKVIEQFGEKTAQIFINLGIADIFHSYTFLALISLLTINIIFGSFKHVFPKLKLLRIPMPWLEANQITKLPVHNEFISNNSLSVCRDELLNLLKENGYKARVNNNQITAESGKFGRLAPTITHIGLLTLLAGVILSSWTGFSGFKPVSLGESFTFTDAEHSKLWLGKLPNWSVKVNETHREDYPNGEAKQWYSNLSILDKDGKQLTQQIISVNNPLSYDGVDIYQSSWGLKALKLHFNAESKVLELQPMGKLYAAFLPLPQKSVIIFSVRNAQAPLRIFAKREDWSTPKLLTQIPITKNCNLGNVSITYDGILPQTGLQYKCDPGLPIIYLAFILLISGISLAAIPHRQIWAQLNSQESLENKIPADNIPLIKSTNDANNTIITIGGTTKKGKISFAKQINKIIAKIQSKIEITSARE